MVQFRNNSILISVPNSDANGNGNGNGNKSGYESAGIDLSPCRTEIIGPV